MRKILTLLFFLFSFSFFFPFQGQTEGTRQLNTNSVNSTSLYLCNDFAAHCNSTNGLRTQFATFNDATSASDNDRLYFITIDPKEVVYMGFQGGTLNGNPARRIVYRIKNLAGTIVQAERNLPTSGTGFINTFTEAWNGPNQLITSTPNGYTASEFTPPLPGTYYIEFTERRTDNNNVNVESFDISLFDLTVADTVAQVAKPGRLYSKSWQFTETGNSNFYGKNYIISDDSIVTSATFTNMDGGAWVQYCNKTGCGNTNWQVDRKSLYHTQVIYPQYKIFLNFPDPVPFPSAVMLGSIVAPWPWGEKNCNDGHILFHINVDKPGDAQIILNFGGLYQPRTLAINNLVVGENTYDWDGLDGTMPVGVPVANNTNMTFTVSYINGLTNLPLYDVEGNTQGFTIGLESPTTGTPAVYWDDSNISGYTVCPPTGCNTPPCHIWSSGGGGWGNLNTINTWWYNVSSSLAPVSIIEARKPQTLSFIQTPPYNYCELSSGHVFTVNTDGNTDEYHFSYSPPAGVTITHNNPGDAFVTISFGAGAASGTLSVYGTNANCVAPGPTTSIPITINSFPTPTLSGPATICLGTSGVTYFTESGKTAYSWSVSAGNTITGGGTPTSSSATVTWSMPGTQYVYVNYSDPASGCTPNIPTAYPVIVNSPPAPTITNNDISVCVNSSGHIYTTEAGMQNYQWNITGGTIDFGGTLTDNYASVTWTSSGPKTISVSYTNPSTSCSATAPTIYNVYVNALPVPSFTTGPTSVCKGIAGKVYETQPGMNNYIWNIPPAATVTSGGTPSSNSVTITWNTAGLQTISVNYTDAFSQCTAPLPTELTVTVHDLPLPVITSPAGVVCQNIPGNIYTTEAGMSNYMWTPTGGTITAGGDIFSNTATITWNTVGPQTLSVNYINSDGCTAVSPTSFPVTVNALPVPTITSSVPSSICRGIPGNVYTTEAGNDNYVWTINGGTITSGGDPLSNTATVTWNTVGPGSISVNYTDPFTQCTAALPRTFDVTVKDLPSPSFLSGPLSVCQQVTGNVYITEAAKTGYLWSVIGGTITAGGTPTSNTATVTWNNVGIGKIFVNYTDPSTLCTAAAPTEYDVTVRAVPLPTISGAFTACVNTPGYQYFTEAGKSNYAWNVTGGTTSAGPSPDIINVLWTTTGTHTISIDYTDADGCNATTPTVQNILVTVLPLPTIAGANAICTGIPVTYTTEAAMSTYTWNYSAGGTLVSGGSSSDNTITINWTTPGAQSVSVNYSLGSGCTALVPTSQVVTVNQSTPPTVSSSVNPVCEASGAVYTTQSGMNAYTWIVSPGGVITSGGNGFNFIGITWNTTSNQTVQANFTNGFGCTAPAPTAYNVSINPLPITTINGTATVCQDFPSTYAYKTSIIDPLASYNWQIVTGSGSITPSATSNPISINWNAAGASRLKVSATSAAGCSDSRTTDILVNPKPEVAMISCFDAVTTRSAKRFILKGGSPLFPASATPQGEYIFSPATAALQYDAVSGNYYFNPALVPGVNPLTFTISYKYTNQFGCPDTKGAAQILVQGPNPACGTTMTDPRDGKTYATTTMGGQCWMAENLNYKKGITPNPISQPMTDNCQVEKYCPPSDPACSVDGAFYQWDELVQYQNTDGPNFQGLCPPGWHIPSETEWQWLIDHADPSFVSPNANALVGSLLKDSFKSFKALMTGVNYLGLQWDFYSGSLTNTMFWTSTTDGPGKAIARGLNDPYNPSVSRYPSGRANAFPVRCIKD